MYKKEALKKILVVLIATFFCHCGLDAQCNYVIEPQGSNRCSSTIRTQYLLPDSTSACRGNVVSYSVVGDSVDIFHYSWLVMGGTIVSYSNDSTNVSILWGEGSEGYIELTRWIENRHCTKTMHVRLVDKPVVACSSVPNHAVSPDGEITIDVCTGDEILLTDRSRSDGTPVTDYYWECDDRTSTEPVFEFTPHEDGVYYIVHRVYNSCGCYDEETITVNAALQCPLEVFCFGSVCGGSNHTYTVITPMCSTYHWSVENGTLLAGQGEQQIIVHWDNPQSGYGVLTLDGSPCECECKARKAIRVPIVSDHMAVKGPDTVCVGEQYLYSLPLHGSTAYNWTVAPMGATMTASSLPNEQYITFNLTGTYNVGASFQCPFLNCTGTSRDKTVVVLDSLRILPRSAEVCQGNAFTCTTDSHLPVRWSVTKGDSLAYDTVGVEMTFVFGRAGSYRILASSGSHCNTAVCLVTVKERPPIPEDLGYPAHACVNSSVMLTGHATSPDNYIEWRSAYGEGTVPDRIEGDTVSIFFPDSIATLLVCQVDRVSGCRSDSVVLRIPGFSLSPLQTNLLEMCPGQTVHVSVADQSEDGVLYNWWVEFPNKATVMADNRSNEVDVMANYTSETMPYTVRLFLKRTSCMGTSTDIVQLRIRDISPPTISASTPACQGSIIYFNMDAEHEAIASAENCRWEGCGSYTGLDYFGAFIEAGEHTVSLHYVSSIGCAPVDVQTAINVHPVFSCYYDTASHPGFICIHFINDEVDNVSYLWNTEETTQCIQYIRGQEYTCQVTFGNSHCSSTPYWQGNLHPPSSDPCTSIQLGNTALRSFPECFNTVNFIRGNEIPSDVIELEVVTHIDNHKKKYTLDRPSTLFQLDNAGPYTASVKWNSNDTCYTAKTTGIVQIYPRIKVKYNCSDSLIIMDSSVYYGGTIPGYRLIHIRNVSVTNPFFITEKELHGISRRTAIPIFLFSEGDTLSITLIRGDCRHKIYYVFHRKPVNVAINARTRICSQTPFLFSASAEGHGLTYKWFFSDNSYNYGQSLWHVFDYGMNYYVNSNTKVVVIDTQGCVDSAYIQTTTKNNPFETGGSYLADLRFDNSDYPKCIGTPLKIAYRSIEEPNSHFDSTQYIWIPPNDTTFGDSNYAFYTGPHFVYATDTQYLCRGADRVDLQFFNIPKAHIKHRKYYCQGENIHLLGNTGSQHLYEWTVTPPTAVEYTYDMANIMFEADETGLWKAKLKVTAPPELGGCSTVDSVTFNVVDPPDAPVIGFVDNECITDGPVPLQSADGHDLVWSNGTYGPHSVYYYDGPVSAYYIDHLTGCKSSPSEILIPQAPRFDALLSGCYYKCNGTENQLDVYSLGTTVNSWIWQVGNTLVNQGQTIPALLNISSSGTYTMSASYGNGCESTSSELKIHGQDCDDDAYKLINVVLTKNELSLEGCHITGHFSFFFDSDADNPFRFDRVVCYPNQTIASLDPPTMLIPPNDTSGVVDLDVVFTDFSQPVVYFILVGDGYQLGQFSVDLLAWLEQQDLGNGCFFANTLDLDFNTTFGSPGQMLFFDFSIHPTVPNVMMLWSDECEIVQQQFNPVTNLMTGMLLLDYGKLSQLVYADSCVNLHLLVCDKEKLCIADTCIPAELLLELASSPQYQPRVLDRDEMDRMSSGSRFALKYHPATDQVTVMETASRTVASSIERIEILSMDGHIKMVVNGSAFLEVNSLPKAMYIVKITTNDGKTEYVKLKKE